jgi:hypothetical protein
MILNDLLPFWDKANHPGGEGWPAVEGRQPEDGYSRFQTEEEIERYLEFVQFNVRHFKGRVQYYELWNEPNNGNVPVQYIKVPDYINLVKRVVPVIRQEDPEAKIVVGSVVLQYDQDYFFELLRSEEIMPLVDVLNWHALFSRSPASELQEDREYYYDYPSIVQAIKDTASAHGFEGEYYAEAGWASPQFTGTPDQTLHTKIQAAKYYARTIVRHLGMDVWIELGEPVPERVIVFATIQNLCTVMAGNRPDSMAVEIESAATNIRSYGFSLPDGDKLFALWTDGMAVDSDAGVSATLVFSSLSAEKAVGIDVLNGFEEELIVETGNGDLVIRNLLVKDYPVIIRLTD